MGNVPDMLNTGAGTSWVVPDCSGENDGCSTFYWTNQQSARLMFYHDHAFGITRLNVYSGRGRGLPDQRRRPSRRWSPTGPSPPNRSRWSSRTGPSCRRAIPQRVRAALRAGPNLGRYPLGQLRRFLVSPRLYAGAESGRPVGLERLRPLDVRSLVLAAGEPAVRAHRQPVLHWASLRPERSSHLGLPDRPVLRAAVDPGHAQHLRRDGAVQRHADRQRDRLSHDHGGAEGVPPAHPERGERPLLQLLAVRGRSDHRQHRPERLGEPIGGTEVAFNPAELASAQIDPNIFPTPDTSLSPPGPDWIVIGNEGGFLPAPVVVPPQPTTWIIDPTVFNVGNVDQALPAGGARGAGRRDRRLLPIRGADADPLQRRAGRLPGPGVDLRLLHGRTGSVLRLAHQPPSPAMGPTPAPSCRSRSRILPRRPPST